MTLRRRSEQHPLKRIVRTALVRLYLRAIDCVRPAEPLAVLTGAIPEQAAYRRASDEGRALTETRLSTLNERADELAQDIA